MLQLVVSFIIEASSALGQTLSKGHALVTQALPFLQNDYVFALAATSVLALVVLYLAVFAEWNKSRLPPRLSLLLPVLAGKYKLKECGPIEMVRQGFKKYGDIFRVRIANQGLTFLIGHEANRLFFEAGDKEWTQKEVYSFTVAVFGKNIVYDAPPSVMIQQLKLVRHGLTGDMMESHAKNILLETQLFFSQWQDEGKVDLVEALGELTILTASRALLGHEIRQRLQKEFAELYHHLNLGMTHLSVFWPSAPTYAHRRRDAARKKIATLFSAVIQERRAFQRDHPEAPKPSDFLQTLIESQYRDGTYATDDEITGLLLAALFAGQHTSSITSVWVGALIIANKQDILPKLLAEQKTVLDSTNGQLTVDALNRMELLHACMKEALRLFPPLVMLMRKVQEPKEYRGYTIPKGDIAVVCPPVTQRDPAVYTNPDKFDPMRWLAPRNEGQQKHDFIAFGGGRHSCLGEKFGFLQVKTIWSILLRRWDFELMQPIPAVDYSSLVAGPATTMFVSYKKRANAF